jgi:hypothetical protein
MIPEITKGMKSIGSKSLLKIKNLSLLEHQINQIKAFDPTASVSILTGFDNDRIVKCLENKYHNLSIVYNYDYEETNQVRCLELYLEHNPKITNLFIISSGILLKKFNYPKSSTSSTIYLLDKPKNHFNIGCDSSTTAEYLFYDLPCPWSECVYLDEEAICALRILMSKTDMKQMYLFEVVNSLIQYGIQFDKTYISPKQILKITSIKDLPKAKNFL